MKHKRLFKIIYFSFIVMLFSYGLSYTVADYLLPDKFDLMLKSIRDILLISLLLLGSLDWRQELFKVLKKFKLPLIILLCAIILSFSNNQQSLLGNIIGLRNDFYWLFCILVVYFAKNYKLFFHNLLRNLLIINVLIAIGQFFLRNNLIWLEKIGYGGENILPLQTIGANIAWYRAFGLLSGPNQFGAVMTIFLLGYLGYIIYQNKLDKYKTVLCLILLIGIILSFSRSAWITIIIGTALTLFYYRRTWLMLFLIISFATLIGTVLIVPNAILHGGIINNNLVGSDINRISSYQESFKLILKNPWGYGAGSVGSTNFLSLSKLNFIVENFHLQLLLNYGILIFFAGLAFIYKFWPKLHSRSQIILISTLILASFLPILSDATVAFSFAYCIIYATALSKAS